MLDVDECFHGLEAVTQGASSCVQAQGFDCYDLVSKQGYQMMHRSDKADTVPTGHGTVFIKLIGHEFGYRHLVDAYIHRHLQTLRYRHARLGLRQEQGRGFTVGFLL